MNLFGALAENPQGTGAGTGQRRGGVEGFGRIELVPIPTYASYLNPIECHFTPISQFVFGNADYLDWDAANFALASHISHRNGLAAIDASTSSSAGTGSRRDHGFQVRRLETRH